MNSRKTFTVNDNSLQRFCGPSKNFISDFVITVICQRYIVEELPVVHGGSFSAIYKPQFLPPVFVKELFHLLEKMSITRNLTRLISEQYATNQQVKKTALLWICNRK